MLDGQWKGPPHFSSFSQSGVPLAPSPHVFRGLGERMLKQETPEPPGLTCGAWAPSPGDRTSQGR